MIKLLHIADLHFGAEDAGLVEAFTRFCSDYKPNLIVAAGDFTQDGRRREFQAAADFFERLGVPVVAAAGNHDVPVRSIWQRFTTPWQRFDRLLGPRVIDRWTSEQLHVETLHTARRAQFGLDWSLGRASQSDVATIVQRLGKSVSRTRILTCHHPLRAPGGLSGRAKTRFGEVAAGVLEASCDLVLTGHLHETFVLPAATPGERCWFVGAGTAFSRRVRGEPAGFNAIEIEDDGIEIRHVEAAQTDRFEFGRAWSLARTGDAG